MSAIIDDRKSWTVTARKSCGILVQDILTKVLYENILQYFQSAISRHFLLVY